MKGVDQNSIDHFSKRRDQIEVYSKQIINDSDAVSNIKDIENHVNDNLINLGLSQINDNTILSKEFHDNEKYIVDVMKSNKENQTECMNKINADTKFAGHG